ncbi:MAG: metallophosphoesterase [Vicinamibacterales bacterium]
MKQLSRLALVLALATPLLAQDEPPRLVAIGDIHGSLDGFTAILKAAGLTGDDGRWSGGRTIFIQTGDYMDRGPGVRAVMDRLMALEAEAKSAGGRAEALLGNHEVMNLIAHTRDTTTTIFAAFADDKSESRREDEWGDYRKLAPAAKLRGSVIPSVYRQNREEWMAAHPRGYVEYRAALAPKGKYGAWLREKPMVVEVVGTILMHAGIPPEAAPERLEDLNQKVKAEIARLDRFRQKMLDKKLITQSFTLTEMAQAAMGEIDTANALIKASNAAGPGVDPATLDMEFLKEAVEILKADTWMVLAEDSPLWYRGYALLPDDEGGPIPALLTKYGARRFVVGHTPQPPFRIVSRFRGRVFVIDTGMLKEHYGGRGSALELKGAEATAIYEDGRVPLGGASTGVPVASFWNHSTVRRSPSSSFTVGR